MSEKIQVSTLTLFIGLCVKGKNNGNHEITTHVHPDSSLALLSAQSVDKTVVAIAGNSMTNTEISIGFTIGEPLIGMVHNDVSIDQGFWAGSLIVEHITGFADCYGIKVYPNPAQDDLNICTDGLRYYCTQWKYIKWHRKFCGIKKQFF